MSPEVMREQLIENYTKMIKRGTHTIDDVPSEFIKADILKRLEEDELAIGTEEV